MTNKNYPNRHPLRRNRERGVALIIALLAMAVLTVIGTALMTSSSVETLINNNFRNSGLAFYASRGGLDEARGRMGPRAVPAVSIPAPINLASATYIRINGGINPAAGCTFPTASGLVDCSDPDFDLTTNRTFLPTAQDAGQVPYVWVKITLVTQRRLKRDLVTPAVVATPAQEAALDDTIPVCWDGGNLFLPPVDCATADLPPAFIFTALSISPGGARRFTREVGSYGQLPTLPAGLTLNGCDPTFQGGTSNQYQVSGIDEGAQADDEAAIGVVCPGDIGPLQASITKQKQDDYPGAGGPSPPPDVQDVSGILDPLYQNCAGLNSLLTTLRGVADNFYSTTPPAETDALPDPGTVDDPVINFVEGDLDISGDFTGAGILVVTGDLRFGGNSTYDGVIYVIGTGNYLQNGAGNGQYNGGIFLADTTDCATTGVLGEPSYRVTGGGNNGIQYNTDLTEPPGGYLPLQLLSLNY